jgi:hypothetical protein
MIYGYNGMWHGGLPRFMYDNFFHNIIDNYLNISIMERERKLFPKIMLNKRVSLRCLVFQDKNGVFKKSASVIEKNASDGRAFGS